MRSLPNLPKMLISRKPSLTAPSSKPTSMPPVLQKKRRASAWPLARRADHQDSCAGRRFGTDGALDIDRRPDARLPASRPLARRTASGCGGRGQGLRCRYPDCAHSGVGRCRSHSAAHQPARTAKHQYKHRNLIERFFFRIKHFRRIATRYDKRAERFSSFIAIVAAFLWLA